MSRKRKQLKQNQLITVRAYAFVVLDTRNNQRVIVAAPVFYQLLRRGWAGQTKINHRREVTDNQITVTEEHVAVLVGRLSFRSLRTAPNGNLCFRSLLLSDGVSIDSSWRRIEREWILAGFPHSVCPQTWEEQIAQQQARQAEIFAECGSWGVPESDPVQTGFFLSPEEAESAIERRQNATI